MDRTMPALYPDYPCQACNGSHTLFYPGVGPMPELSKPWFYTCARLPVPMRVVRGSRWAPVRRKPDGAIEVYLGEAQK